MIWGVRMHGNACLCATKAVPKTGYSAQPPLLRPWSFRKLARLSSTCFSCCDQILVTTLLCMTLWLSREWKTPLQTDRISLNSIHCNPLRPWQFVVGGSDIFARVYDQRRSLVSTSSYSLSTSTAAAMAVPVSSLPLWKTSNSADSRGLHFLFEDILVLML